MALPDVEERPAMIGSLQETMATSNNDRQKRAATVKKTRAAGRVGQMTEMANCGREDSGSSELLEGSWQRDRLARLLTSDVEEAADDNFEQPYHKLGQ